MAQAARAPRRPFGSKRGPLASPAWVPGSRRRAPVRVLSLSNTQPWKPAARSAPQLTQRMSGTDRCGSASGWSLWGTAQRAGRARWRASWGAGRLLR